MDYSVKTINKLIDLLTFYERWQTMLLMGMVLVMALFDMIGVASIMPFMAVLANPQMVQTNPVLLMIYKGGGFTDPQRFLFFLGIMVFAMLVISLSFKALCSYLQLRFVQMHEYRLSVRLIESYLHQPYYWFLNRHSGGLGKAVLSEVGLVIGNALMPAIQMTSAGAVILSLVSLLVFFNPTLAIMVGGVLGSAYALLYVVMHRFLNRIGVERLQANEKRFTVVTEAFGGIKEIKVGGFEQVYVNRFAIPAKIYAQHQASATVVSQLPRYFMELLAFGGILLIILYLMGENGSLDKTLPIISLYAFAGLRLMPALQQFYAYSTIFRFAGPALDALHADLVNLIPGTLQQAEVPFKPMRLSSCITLHEICYTYPEAQQAALKNLSLDIPARSTIGLIGATGSGKTTAVDLILGLLEPQSGKLVVDGVPVEPSNRRSWQNIVGYVPQQIYLSDDTVAANIAFGHEAADVDHAAVERAARIANLHDFVVNNLQDGYATFVGERGVRLSGGQRQRIGIARALYHNPQVLILDEATSALDNITEQVVMEAVHNLGHEITIIHIAHRLNTVRECDKIFLLDGGRVIAEGTYEELLSSSDMFQAMNAC